MVVVVVVLNRGWAKNRHQWLFIILLFSRFALVAWVVVFLPVMLFLSPPWWAIYWLVVFRQYGTRAERRMGIVALLILALAAAFQEISGRLRYGLRMPSGLDASLDAHRVEAAGDVGRLDRAVGRFLIEALRETGVCCTIALETHEGPVEYLPCEPAEGGEGSEGGEGGARLAVLIDPNPNHNPRPNANPDPN